MSNPFTELATPDLVGHERGAPVLKHHPPVLGVCLSLHWMQPSPFCFCVLSACDQLVRVALKLRSLRIQPPPPSVSLRGVLIHMDPLFNTTHRSLVAQDKFHSRLGRFTKDEWHDVLA